MRKRDTAFFLLVAYFRPIIGRFRSSFIFPFFSIPLSVVSLTCLSHFASSYLLCDSPLYNSAFIQIILCLRGPQLLFHYFLLYFTRILISIIYTLFLIAICYAKENNVFLLLSVHDCSVSLTVSHTLGVYSRIYVLTRAEEFCS